MEHVVIFGAGIAGMTVAHELIEKGYNVDVYEAKGRTGGIARTERTETGVPIEYSWRGFGPFYHNLFDVAKRIPYVRTSKYQDNLPPSLAKDRFPDHTETVYDQLSEPIIFIYARDDLHKGEGGIIQKWGLDARVGGRDKMTLAMLFGLQVIHSADRMKRDWHGVNFKNMMKGRLSENGYNIIINVLSPMMGIDKTDPSVYDVLHFLSMNIFDKTDPYAGLKNSQDPEGQLISKVNKWKITREPLSESWFDPWQVYLEKMGVNFHFHHKLKRIIVAPDTHSKIALVETDNKCMMIHLDKVVLAVDPFTLSDLVDKDPVMLSDKTLSLVKPLIATGSHRQISFRIGFNKKIRLDRPGTVLAFPDSEYNITVCPYDNLWNEGVYLGDGNLSLWTGTACDVTGIGRVYGKQADELTKKQFIDEVLEQIFASIGLQGLIQEVNGFNLDRSIINMTEVWHEWEEVEGGGMVCNYKKWVSNTYNTPYRPGQVTGIDGMYLCGAHTRQTMHIYSMEGAVETGKIVAGHILNIN